MQKLPPAPVVMNATTFPTRSVISMLHPPSPDSPASCMPFPLASLNFKTQISVKPDGVGVLVGAGTVGVADRVAVVVAVRVRVGVADVGVPVGVLLGCGVAVGEGDMVKVAVTVRVGVGAVAVGLGVVEGVAVNVGGLTGHWTIWICPFRIPLKSMPVGV